MKSDPQKIRLIFIEHLNRLHCVKAHLVERLVDIAEEGKFNTVKTVIDETIANTEEQIILIDKIYDLLNASYSFDNCTALISLLEDMFAEFQQHSTDSYLPYVLILSYLNHIDCIEKAAFAVLKVLAQTMGDSNIVDAVDNISVQNTDTLITELNEICIAGA